MDSSTRTQDMLRRFSVRSSTAALRNAAASERTRVIVVALAANLVVALAKLAAGVLTGSAALFAEAGHSLADSLNEVLLGVSLRRGSVPADAAHPLGHGRERFLWAFMAAIASFLIGGGVCGGCRGGTPRGGAGGGGHSSPCAVRVGAALP